MCFCGGKHYMQSQSKKAVVRIPGVLAKSLDVSVFAYVGISRHSCFFHVDCWPDVVSQVWVLLSSCGHFNPTFTLKELGWLQTTTVTLQSMSWNCYCCLWQCVPNYFQDIKIKKEMMQKHWTYISIMI